MKKIITLIVLCFISSAYSQTSTELISRGLEKARVNDNQGAILDFDAAIKIDSSNGEVYYHRGISKFKLSELDDALSDFTKAISLLPSYSAAYTSRGCIYFVTEKNIEAIADLDKAIELDRENSDAYYYRGYSWFYEGKPEKAYSDFDAAVKLKPTGDNYLAKGIVEESLRKYKESISDLDKALELDSSLVHAYYVRGYSKYNLQMKKEACLDWTVSLILGNKNATALLEKYSNP